MAGTGGGMIGGAVVLRLGTVAVVIREEMFIGAGETEWPFEGFTGRITAVRREGEGLVEAVVELGKGTFGEETWGVAGKLSADDFVDAAGLTAGGGFVAGRSTLDGVATGRGVLVCERKTRGAGTGVLTYTGGGCCRTGGAELEGVGILRVEPWGVKIAGGRRMWVAIGGC